jgi:hypothetical protein
MKEKKIVMKAAASPGIDVGRIVEIAKAIAPEVSVFDASLGIDDKCLSAEKLVQLLHQGVHGEDAAHLMGCSTCAENVRNLQNVSLKSNRDFVGNALRRTVSQREAPFKDEFLPVILAIPEEMIGVSTEEGTGSFAFTCGLFPVSSNLDEIDVSSIQATGAIVSQGMPTVERVDLNEDGIVDFIKLTFAKGHLAARVQEAIRSHQNVVDTVRIDGSMLREKGKKRLVGQARIEFANRADLLHP